jgi:anti-sigma factor RsiW
MNTRVDHVSREVIQAFLDGRLDPETLRLVSDHLTVCRECRWESKGLQALDRALRQMPLERTGAAFTATVMRRLGLSPEGKRVGSLAENLAYLAGLLIVLGLMVTVFLLTGVFGSSSNVTDLSAVADAVAKARDATGKGLGEFARWLVTFFPFAFGKGALGISIAVLLIASALAIVDRTVGRRPLHRTE